MLAHEVNIKNKVSCAFSLDNFDHRGVQPADGLNFYHRGIQPAIVVERLDAQTNWTANVTESAILVHEAGWWQSHSRKGIYRTTVL